MKPIIILLSVIIINLADAKAEESVQNNAIYSTSEINIGNYYGIDINLNYVYDEEYSIKLGYTGNIRSPKSRPYDYSSGFVGVIFLSFLGPYDHFDSYQFCVGKIFKLNEEGTIRINFSVGLGYTTIKEPTNWTPNRDGIVAANYDWEYYQYNKFSYIINPKIEFPLTEYVGLTISPMAQINEDRAYYGLGAGLMIGLLRD